MYNAMPTAANMTNYLENFGILTTPQSGTAIAEMQAAVGAAIEEFQRRTGYWPFLGDTADVTMYFSPRDIDFPPDEFPHLDFAKSGGPGGILSITSLKTGVQNGTGGSALVQGVDFALRPRNAALKQKPYTYVEFIKAPQFGFYGLAGDVDSIQIVGKRGFWTGINESVWQGILAGAAAKLQPGISGLLSRGLLMWKEGDVQNQYGQKGALGGEAEAWTSQFERAIATHKRVSIL